MNEGERIVQLRENLGLSQYALAKNARVAQPSLLDIERGKTTPNVKTLRKLCSALGITLAEFFAEETEVDPGETEILAAYRQLPDDKKEMAARVIRAL